MSVTVYLVRGTRFTLRVYASPTIQWSVRMEKHVDYDCHTYTQSRIRPVTGAHVSGVAVSLSGAAQDVTVKGHVPQNRNVGVLTLHCQAAIHSHVFLEHCIYHFQDAGVDQSPSRLVWKFGRHSTNTVCGRYCEHVVTLGT